MPAFFLTFLATALAALAGRDALRLAGLSAAHGRAGMLLVATALASAGYAALAAWLAGELAGVLQGAGARLFAALALAMAGGEVLLLRAGRDPAEPTRSLGATVLVLFAGLLTGATGFLVLAMSVLTGAPVLAGAGGAAGTLAALAVAALAGREWDRVPHAGLRAACGSALMLAALVTGYLALGSAQ